MKRQCLIVLATMAAIIIGLCSLALAQSRVVAQVHGNTSCKTPLTTCCSGTVIQFIQVFSAPCLPVRRRICLDISTSRPPRLPRSVKDGLTCLSRCMNLSPLRRQISSSTIFGSSREGASSISPGISLPSAWPGTEVHGEPIGWRF